MSLEERIVEWANSRPVWQRTVLRQVAAGQPPTPNELAKLVESLVSGKAPANVEFSLSDLPDTAPGAPPVLLRSILDLSHVNALESDVPLSFAAEGLTIVYGDNGSGKSGYARILKRIARARQREDVLSDVFRDTAIAQPKATIKAMIGETEASGEWPDSAPPALRSILYYDDSCGDAYISAESEFPYRPAALFLIDGLIDVCSEVRRLVDERLEANTKSAQHLPIVDVDIATSPLGSYLNSLSAKSSLEELAHLLATAGRRSLDQVRQEEAELLGGDPGKTIQRLELQGVKLREIQEHLEHLDLLLNHEALSRADAIRSELQNLEADVRKLAEAFTGEPLPGSGSDIWRAMWNAARNYSESQAYAGENFPKVTDGARCVLCQQSVGKDAADRLTRFERFVSGDEQSRLSEATSLWDETTRRIRQLHVVPDKIAAHLRDLEADHHDLVASLHSHFQRYEEARHAVLAGLNRPDKLAPLAVDTGDFITEKLTSAAEVVQESAQVLADPKAHKARLTDVTKERKILELVEAVKAKLDAIGDEVDRLKERKSLEDAKAAAATGAITRKVLELSEQSITEVVRDTFTRETEQLNLRRVTITKTRADRGALLHQPKLVGARQNVTLPRVFSEGEQTALGLAAFFTETTLDTSKSAIVLDDPVTSLDHIRRSRVATRMVRFAQTRQVIVFTHDVSFVAELKREAVGMGVPVTERSVSRRRGGDQKPGACSPTHPWKAKDVPTRIDALKRELARFRKEVDGWDETTYEKEVAGWAGNLSETWERIFSEEIVGRLLPEGRLEVRPLMVKLLARFTEDDEREFQASYGRVSQWAKRHDKATKVNYVAPEVDDLATELELVEGWFRRVKKYAN